MNSQKYFKTFYILAHLVPLKNFFQKKIELNFFGYEILKWKE